MLESGAVARNAYRSRRRARLPTVKRIVLLLHEDLLASVDINSRSSRLLRKLIAVDSVPRSGVVSISASILFTPVEGATPTYSFQINPFSV